MYVPDFFVFIVFKGPDLTIATNNGNSCAELRLYVDISTTVLIEETVYNSLTNRCVLRILKQKRIINP